MVKLASCEQLEGSSCPPSPSSPRVRREGKRTGIIKRKTDGYRRSSRKRGRNTKTEPEAESELRALSMGSDRESDRGVPAYAGWVYHVGTSSLGYQFCTDRFLVIKGKYVTMFKRNPVEYPRAVRTRFLSDPVPTFA
jgi:hypothetical protein